MARKEGGAWRGGEGGGDVSRQTGVGPSQKTHKGGEAPLPCNAEELAGQGASLLTPSARDPARHPKPAFQMPSSYPQGQSEVDLYLLESPGVPGGSPMAPGEPNRPQHPGSCRPSKLPVHSWAPCACVPEAAVMQRPDISLLTNSRVGEGREGCACVCDVCAHRYRVL